MKIGNYSKDFVLVLIGQIISLFGNAVLRFALPLHLLNATGSAALLGIVSGCSFLPMVLMAPVGGVIADRVNKRNIMVALDFFTAGLTFIFFLMFERMNLAVIILIMLFLLYGISGAYQPSVQSSVPLLVKEENVLSANAMINMVSSLSSLLGPALGGIVYNTWGIDPVLIICSVSFFLSAVMEIFIQIPYERQQKNTSWLRVIIEDLSESLHFIIAKKPALWKLTLCCGGINFVMSALIVIGYPVLVTQILQFKSGNASEMYGFMQAILAVGGLAGGVVTGAAGSRLRIRQSWKILLAAALFLLPAGAAIFIKTADILIYVILAVCGFFIMAGSTIYTVQVMSYIQIVTPPELVGKIIAGIIAVSSSSMPLGQILYGMLFENLKGMEAWIFVAGAVAAGGISLYAKQVSEKL